MTHYLLIESRDPFESADVAFCYDLAGRLAAAGNEVTLFLVQNGVLPARAGAQTPAFEALAHSGIEILADDFSLRERGIAADRMRPGVKPSPLDRVIDCLAAGCKAIWH
ncbi:MAG TPA: DsrE family protein [Stellaceae bacterium]|nr:DsrE family protein [Stellaceae bacterium]